MTQPPPTPSTTDWIQTILQALTLIGVGAYTIITYRMFKESQRQNQAIAEQLDLQRKEFAEQRAAADELSMPVLRWSNPGGDRSKRLAMLFFRNHGEPLTNLSIDAAQITSQATVTPTDYLDRETDGKISLILPQPETDGLQPFHFELICTTKTGAKIKTKYEVKIPAQPRKVGHSRIN